VVAALRFLLRGRPPCLLDKDFEAVRDRAGEDGTPAPAVGMDACGILALLHAGAPEALGLAGAAADADAADAADDAAAAPTSRVSHSRSVVRRASRRSRLEGGAAVSGPAGGPAGLAAAAGAAAGAAAAAAADPRPHSRRRIRPRGPLGLPRATFRGKRELRRLAPSLRLGGQPPQPSPLPLPRGGDRPPTDPTAHRDPCGRYGKQRNPQFDSRTKRNRWQGIKRQNHTVRFLRLKSQVSEFNHSGMARTLDNQFDPHTTPTPLPRPPRRQVGRGRGGGAQRSNAGGAHWKSWAPASIARAAFAEKTQTAKAGARNAGVKTGGTAHYSRHVVAGTVQAAAERCLKRACDESRGDGRPHKFYITNNMYDETRLAIKRDKQIKQVSVLAAHSQISYLPAASGLAAGAASASAGLPVAFGLAGAAAAAASGASGHDDDDDVHAHICDVEVTRCPAELEKYKATNCSAHVCRPDDDASIVPRHEARAKAEYYGHLMSSDAHSVNKLLEKNVNALLDDMPQGEKHCALAMYCFQHKTGNIVEAVTKYLGVLDDSFCYACLNSNADWLDGLRESVRAVVREKLVVAPPEEIPTDAFGEGVDFGAALLETCFVGPQSAASGEAALGTGEKDEEETARAKRQALADDLRAFFPTSWFGTLYHPCPPGCCGERACADQERSITRACELILSVILVAVCVPSLNKWTKVEPVIAQITLMVHFFEIIPCALRRLYRQKVGRRADVATAIDQAAVVAVPQDPRAHETQIANKRTARVLSFFGSKDRTDFSIGPLGRRTTWT
jgi:hypothetical protein